MGYLAMRRLHIACAIGSITLFAMRGALALASVGWRRWLPHLNDTVLLGSAVRPARTSGRYPGQQVWLGAKLVALLAYTPLRRRALMIP